ncbi:dehydrogenase/reductase SDR family member 7-like [Dermacentor andersoni]|uniref:dehydrogenase/reductase SDR family member 7-like n=1 Tax=Dermacentor andersoni TaxID=34620 RepID=UPI0024173AD2|nr:dehydrogenase/reductase SDR family member 7-like [Dermacentor andersoni]
MACLVSWLPYMGVPGLMAFFAWLKLADADLMLLFKSKFGRSIVTLRGKVIWITGSSSGIGEYLAYELAKVGSRLVLSGTNLESLELEKNNCLEFGKDEGTEVVVLPFSICNFSTHSEQLQKVLDHFVKLDVLVNNAGRSQRANFEEIPVEIDKEMFDCNTFGAISLTRCAVKYFKEKGVQARVVVTSSTAGKLGAPFSATYTGSKHALQGYYECLRLEGVILGGLDVTVTYPGPVFSRIRERAFTATPGKLYNMKDTPKSRLMPIERCAQLIAVAIANNMDEVWIS